MKRLMILILALVSAVTVSAQTDRKEVRAGNKAFRKGDFRKSEIDYRRAVLKDSLSVAAQYNLASSLYRQDDYEGAQKALSSIAETLSGIEAAETKADFYFNQGDVALAQNASAVKSFRQSLLLRPDDMDAKENYIYAKEMLRQSQDNQGGQDGDNSQNQDDQNNQNNQDNQDNNQQQNNNNQQQNNQNQQNPQDQNNAAAEGNISRQQARQMLNAIQAKEKETQDKVKKEKAEMLKSRQKEKNW